MAELKTKMNKASVAKFLNSVRDPKRRNDAKKVLALMKKVTKQKPVMWGGSIVGFGKYHYKSERSSQEGDWPMTGFSPRKQALTVYVMLGLKQHRALLKKLGPHKISGGSCIYIRDLDKVNTRVLGEIIKRGYNAMKKKYG